MVKKQILLDPQVGPNSTIDPDVRLNVMPGRSILKLRPLKLGAHAQIRSGSVLYAHASIGDYFQTGHHVVVREETFIGHHVSVWNGTTIDYGCEIGHHVKIHCNCYIAQYSVLEDHVFLAPGVVLANDLFPGSAHAMQLLQGPIIRKGAQIGVNVTILPGVEIGARAIIGAGSVVTSDVPADSVVWGNPARVRKTRSALRWPATYALRRKEAARLYRRLSGQRAY